jgi:hypothetical protein
MDPFDDYENEMERLTDDEIEVVLSGGDHSSRHLTTLIRDVRLGLLENPSPDIAVRHLAAMAGARGPAILPAAGGPAARVSPRRVLPKRRLTALALAAALLFLAGIAAAVTLPKKTDPPSPETVSKTTPSMPPAGQDLPEEAAHGQAVADVAKDRSRTGCEKGQAVADVASAKAVENRNNPAEKNDPCSRTGTKDKSNSGRRGDVPDGPGGVSRRRNSHSAGGAGSANAPGLGGEEPGVRGSEARGRSGEGAHTAAGSRGASGGGGAPKDLPSA